MEMSLSHSLNFVNRDAVVFNPPEHAGEIINCNLSLFGFCDLKCYSLPFVPFIPVVRPAHFSSHYFSFYQYTFYYEDII